MWKISKVEIYKDSQEDGKTSRTENKIRESLFKIEILKIKINIGGINLANYRSIIRRRNSKSSKSVAGDTHEVIRVRTPQKDRNEVWQQY